MVVFFDKFESKDAFLMDWIEKDVFLYHLKSSPQFFHILEANAQSYTMCAIEGNFRTILGIVTLYEQSPKHCYLNMFMAKDIQTKFNKEILQGLKNFVNCTLGAYWRISMDGKTSNTKLRKLCKSLGFKEEGVMECYGPNGEDYTLFAKIQRK